MSLKTLHVTYSQIQGAYRLPRRCFTTCCQPSLHLLVAPSSACSTPISLFLFLAHIALHVLYPLSFTVLHPLWLMEKNIVPIDWDKKLVLCHREAKLVIRSGCVEYFKSLLINSCDVRPFDTKFYVLRGGRRKKWQRVITDFTLTFSWFIDRLFCDMK